MNGAGNDFVVLDARQESLVLNFEQVRALASRDNTMTQGCDQVIVLEASKKADVFMRIYNADGGEVDACGNATRCVGSKIIQEKHAQSLHDTNVTIETNAGVLSCHWTDAVFYREIYSGKADAIMEADMGSPRFTAGEIPVGNEFTNADLRVIARDLGIDFLVDAACVGMGNPHVVFFVSQLPPMLVLESAGEWVKTIPLFEHHGVNLTIAEVSDTAIFAFVYERGAGVTKSCGTAACATAVAAITLGYHNKDVDIQVQQLQREAQDLFVRWEEKNNKVFLIGPVKKEFEGTLDV